MDIKVHRRKKKTKIKETNTSESWLQKTDIQRGKTNSYLAKVTEIWMIIKEAPETKRKRTQKVWEKLPVICILIEATTGWEDN